MFILNLNDMRSAKIEMLEPVAKAETREELVAFIEREKAPESWKDGRWGKSFKQGSALEWYNWPFDFDSRNHFVEVPSKEVYAQQMYDAALQDWDEKIGSIPDLEHVQRDIEVTPNGSLTGAMLKHQTKIQRIQDLNYHIHTCSLCNYKCGYVIEQGNLFYDSGCYCTNRSRNLEPRGWEDLANHYNNMSDLAKKTEFETIWGLAPTC